MRNCESMPAGVLLCDLVFRKEFFFFLSCFLIQVCQRATIMAGCTKSEQQGAVTFWYWRTPNCTAAEPEHKQNFNSFLLRGENGGSGSRTSWPSGSVCRCPVGSGSQAVLAPWSRYNSGLPCCHRRHPSSLRRPGHSAVPGWAGLHA